MQLQKPCGWWNVDCSSTAIRIKLVIILQDVLGVATARAFPLAKSVTAAVRVSYPDIPPRYRSVALFRVAPFTRIDFPHHFYPFPSTDEFVAPFLRPCYRVNDSKIFFIVWNGMTFDDLSTVGNDEQNFKNKVKIKKCRVIINCNDERSYTKSG